MANKKPPQIVLENQMAFFHPDTSWSAESTTLWIPFDARDMGLTSEMRSAFPRPQFTAAWRVCPEWTGKVCWGGNTPFPSLGIVVLSHWQVFVIQMHSYKTFLWRLGKTESEDTWIPWPSLNSLYSQRICRQAGRSLKNNTHVPTLRQKHMFISCKRVRLSAIFKTLQRKGNSTTSSNSCFIHQLH